MNHFIYYYYFSYLNDLNLVFKNLSLPVYFKIER